jgi:hypothetical protein
VLRTSDLRINLYLAIPKVDRHLIEDVVIKTYEGQGSESVLLADWTSLHLDIMARDRGLMRFAGSLYQL